MSSILQELEAQIANVSTSVEKTNIGIVRETGDGVAKGRRTQRRPAERDDRIPWRTDRTRP